MGLIEDQRVTGGWLDGISPLHWQLPIWGPPLSNFSWITAAKLHNPAPPGAMNYSSKIF